MIWLVVIAWLMPSKHLFIFHVVIHFTPAACVLTQYSSAHSAPPSVQQFKYILFLYCYCTVGFILWFNAMTDSQ